MTDTSLIDPNVIRDDRPIRKRDLRDQLEQAKTEITRLQQQGVDVRIFGAKSDDITDDAEAIRLALSNSITADQAGLIPAGVTLLAASQILGDDTPNALMGIQGRDAEGVTVRLRGVGKTASILKSGLDIENCIS